jgi:hypothetical protein
MKVAQPPEYFSTRRASPSGGDWRHRLSGYMIENALVAGFTSLVSTSVARADATPALPAHPFDAGGCRRHDFGLA